MTHTIEQTVGQDMDNTELSEIIQNARRDAELGSFETALLSLDKVQRTVDAADFDSVSRIATAIGSVMAKKKSCEALMKKLATQVKNKLWSEAQATCSLILGIASRHETALQSRKQIELELLASGVGVQDGSPENCINQNGSLQMGTPAFQAESGQPDLVGSGEESTNSESVDISPDGLAKTQHMSRNSLAESVRLAPSEQYAVSQPASPELPILWIDGVGGFTLCDRDESILGQAAPGSDAALKLQGDLSRRAASFRRGDGSHLIQPLQETLLNGQILDRAAILNSGDAIQIGSRVQLVYTKPNRLSTTGRIELLSNHRWQPFVEAVLLLGNNFVVGPKANAHIRCDFSTADIVFFRRQSHWWCRCESGLEINGEETDQPIKLNRQQRIRAGEVTLVLE